ncbi:glycosyltransferase [Sphingobacterium sp. LRF_L2]|uniref:glycosyltransferase n=1 Tax=Sphingobacterium sp. LRF_L2 TaxID=3369421 RepID=UPI003F5FF638
MKISVLLSLFGKENPSYFDISMRSIWDDQLRKPDEIVLVEDGPLTDQLYRVIDKWKQKLGNILVIEKLSENSGLAIALNQGISRCSGDYIARMDTDDISLPERFLIQEEYLKKNSDIMLLGGGMVEFNETDGEIATRIMPENYNEIKQTFCKTNPFVHPAVIINKAIFDRGMYYNPNLRRNQDLEFWFRIVADGYKVANVPDIILKFRKNPNLYKKRNNSARSELVIYLKGIHSLYGLFTWRYIYPFIHYLYRLLPKGISLWIYKNIIAKYWKR